MCFSKLSFSSCDDMLARCMPWNRQYCAALYQFACTYNVNKHNARTHVIILYECSMCTNMHSAHTRCTRAHTCGIIYEHDVLNEYFIMDLLFVICLVKYDWITPCSDETFRSARMNTEWNTTCSTLAKYRLRGSRHSTGGGRKSSIYAILMKWLVDCYHMHSTEATVKTYGVFFCLMLMRVEIWFNVLHRWLARLTYINSWYV